MTIPKKLSTTRRLALATAAGGVATMLAATSAMGAPFTAQSSARALHLSVINPAVVVDTGAEVAENDGSVEEVTASETPLISLLDGQEVLTAGVLGETAVARNDGTSGACAGVTGEGGAVEVGDAAGCLTPGTSPVQLKLADVIAVSASIEADAISSTCVGGADGTTSGEGQLVNARLVVKQPLLPEITVRLDSSVAPNTKLLDLVSPTVATLLSPLLDVTLNKQDPLDPAEEGDGYYGGLSVTAISVDALGGALADVELATVTCGPSADLAIVPVVPLAGIPVALGTLAVVGAGAGVITRRRKRAAL